MPSLTWLRAEHDGPDGLVIDIIDLANEAWPIERGESVVRFRVDKRAVLGAVLHQLVKLRDGFEGKTANAAAFPFDALAKVLAKRERSRARLGRGG